MALPDPVAGMVIRYSYLWSDERRKGREEGAKDRPCVVVLAVTREDDKIIVTVAPITHRPPQPDSGAIEIPIDQKRRLRLDDEQSWIVTDELNRFNWPGPDLKTVDARKPGRFSYGLISRDLYYKVRDAIVSQGRTRKLKIDDR